MSETKIKLFQPLKLFQKYSEIIWKYFRASFRMRNKIISVGRAQKLK